MVKQNFLVDIAILNKHLASTLTKKIVSIVKGTKSLAVCVKSALGYIPGIGVLVSEHWTVE